MRDLTKTQVPEMHELLRDEILKSIKRQGLTQAEVGERVGMLRGNVNKTLRGTERGITIDQLIRIANGIGIEVKLTFKRGKS